MVFDHLKQHLTAWAAELTTPTAQLRIEADPNKPGDVASAIDALLQLLQAARPPGAQLPSLPAMPIPAPLVAVTAQVSAPLTLDECCDRWVSVESAAWDPKTTVEYRKAGREFLARLKAKGLIDDYKAYLASERGLRPKTVNKYLSALGSLFGWAKGAGHWPKTAELPTAGQLYTKAQLAKTSLPWLPFTAQQLQLVFEPARWRSQRTAHEYWVALLCLHLALR